MYEKLNQDCGQGLEVTEEDCKLAGLSLNGKLRNDAVVVGEWNWVPRGCSIETRSNDIHYNKLSNPTQPHYAGFGPVCKKVSGYVYT